MRNNRVEGLHDRWGGFGDQQEWDLARFLVKSGLSQGKIDEFLKLKIASMFIDDLAVISHGTDPRPNKASLSQQMIFLQIY